MERAVVGLRFGCEDGSFLDLGDALGATEEDELVSD